MVKEKLFTVTIINTLYINDINIKLLDSKSKGIWCKSKADAQL